VPTKIGPLLARGELPDCAGCPRNPQTSSSAFFGFSCSEHLSAGSAVELMWLMADPGKEVRTTGRLCMVHNIADPTSRNALRVLRHLGIGGGIDAPSGWYGHLAAVDRERLHKIFAGNAVMHGGVDATLSEAADHCQGVVEQMIRATRPRVILAFGAQATRCLWQIEHGSPLHGRIDSLWDGRPRRIMGIPSYFLLHHSPRGVANAVGWGHDPERLWLKTGNAIRLDLGWV
jgi:hypothetical protein